VRTVSKNRLLFVRINQNLNMSALVTLEADVVTVTCSFQQLALWGRDQYWLKSSLLLLHSRAEGQFYSTAFVRLHFVRLNFVSLHFISLHFDCILFDCILFDCILFDCILFGCNLFDYICPISLCANGLCPNRSYLPRVCRRKSR
jgi:hypothetical protein